MDCSDSERVAAYAEGRLGDAEAAHLLEHCSDCEDCRRELALLSLARGQGEASVPVPADLRSRTAKAIVRVLERERDRTPRRGHVRLFVPERRSYVGAVAATALLVAVAGMVALVKMRENGGPPRDVVVTPPAPRIQEQEVRPEETVVRPVPRPKVQDPAPREVVPEPPPPDAPKLQEKRSEPPPEPPVRGPAPRLDETRPEEAPSKPTHTIVARALSELQVTDFTGSLTVRRRGAKEKEKLVGVARLGEGDIVMSERVSSFQVEGRHPVVLGENTQVSLAYVAQEQAPYLHIRSGEAMVDSTGPSRWIVSDGRVAVVIKQARARFSTAPGEDRLHVTPLTEPLYVQPDGGEIHPVRPGEEFQVGKSGAEVRRLDPARVQMKSAAFEAARPRQRTIFYTSCDPADAKREHFFVLEGTYFKSESLLSRERPDRTVAASIGPNPRFTWREGLLLRFRFMTNAKDLQVTLRVDERKYTLFKSFPVERKNMNQWIWAEVPITPNGLQFRRDDGVNQLLITSQDKFDSFRFVVRQQDVFGDQRAYFLVDDIQVVEKE